MAERDGGLLRDSQGRRVLKNVAQDAAKAVSDVLMAGTLVDGEGREIVSIENVADATANMRLTTIESPGWVTTDRVAAGASGPAAGTFSVYRAAARSVTDGAAVQFDARAFDVSSWYDLTNLRYQPAIPGYYRFSACVSANVLLTADAYWFLNLRRDGVTQVVSPIVFQRGVGGCQAGGTWILYANGSHYFDITVSHNAGSAVAIDTRASQTYFQGELIGKA